MIKVTFTIVLLLCLRQTAATFLDFLPMSVLRERSRSNPRSLNGYLPLPDFLSLVRRHGYPAEEYEVLTDDGYKLKAHRIPGSPTQPKAPGKPVVYIQHGILASSDMFVIGGPEKDLAFLLADAGYDVWLGNGRGNTYSRSHVRLSPETPIFWEFSFEEIALRDVSKTIDFILYETKQKSVIYVAHSMGTTVGLILLSSKPEYNQKIRLVVNLAPIGYWKKPRNLMRYFMFNGQYVRALLIALGMSEVLPQMLITARVTNSSCRDGTLLQAICKTITHFISGNNADLLDVVRYVLFCSSLYDLLTDGLAYFPAGVSTRTLSHFYQNIVAGKLQKYDKGYIQNLLHYGQPSPPEYNLKNIDVPVYLIYGKADAVAPPEDSFDLVTRLNNAHVESVPHDNFTHLDFVWGRNIKTLLHDRVMEIIESARYA
ncbi:lipase 3-like [Phymastichus coffea]|uniref:lipase 3-like n=1 Tax=Phymastichus coffea TaxID=108790 RepID=UPI00273BED42|nr:lipase 3-like [Phymastichus coffea]